MKIFHHVLWKIQDRWDDVLDYWSDTEYDDP